MTKRIVQIAGRESGALDSDFLLECNNAVSYERQGEDPEEEFRCHVSSGDEGMEVVVGEHFRPLSCVVLCAGTFGDGTWVSDVVPCGGVLQLQLQLRRSKHI